MLNDYKLMEKKGKYYPYEYLEIALYGYDNKYALLVRRAYGGVKSRNTIDAKEGKYEVLPCGMILKKSDIVDTGIAENDLKEMIEVLTDDEWKIVKSTLQESNIHFNIDDVKRKIDSVSKEDLEIISDVINQLNNKVAHKKITFENYVTYKKDAKIEDYGIE